MVIPKIMTQMKNTNCQFWRRYSHVNCRGIESFILCAIDLGFGGFDGTSHFPMLNVNSKSTYCGLQLLVLQSISAVHLRLRFSRSPSCLLICSFKSSMVMPVRGRLSSSADPTVSRYRACTRDSTSFSSNFMPFSSMQAFITSRSSDS